MSSKRRLAIVPPSRPADPARLRLNAAIKGAAKAKLALAEHQQAIRRAGEQLAESERQVEKARASVDAARHNFEGELAEAIAAGRAIPATSQVLGRADAAVAEAARTAEAVRAARDLLKADLRSVEVELRLADLDVLCKVNALTAPSVERLVVEAERASATLTRASAVLRYLTSLNMTGVGSSAADREVDDAALAGLPWSVREAARAAKQVVPAELEARARALSQFAQFNVPADVVQLVDQWRSARYVLRTDPNAALPELPDAT
jgi:hypothetical protein